MLRSVDDVSRADVSTATIDLIDQEMVSPFLGSHAGTIKLTVGRVPCRTLVFTKRTDEVI